MVTGMVAGTRGDPIWLQGNVLPTIITSGLTALGRQTGLQPAATPLRGAHLLRLAITISVTSKRYGSSQGVHSPRRILTERICYYNVMAKQFRNERNVSFFIQPLANTLDVIIRPPKTATLSGDQVVLRGLYVAVSCETGSSWPSSTLREAKSCRS